QLSTMAGEQRRLDRTCCSSVAYTHHSSPVVQYCVSGLRGSPKVRSTPSPDLSPLKAPRFVLAPTTPAGGVELRRACTPVLLGRHQRGEDRAGPVGGAAGTGAVSPFCRAGIWGWICGFVVTVGD